MRTEKRALAHEERLYIESIYSQKPRKIIEKSLILALLLVSFQIIIGFLLQQAVEELKAYPLKTFFVLDSLLLAGLYAGSRLTRTNKAKKIIEQELVIVHYFETHKYVQQDLENAEGFTLYVVDMGMNKTLAFVTDDYLENGIESKLVVEVFSGGKLLSEKYDDIVLRAATNGGKAERMNVHHHLPIQGAFVIMDKSFEEVIKNT